MKNFIKRHRKNILKYVVLSILMVSEALIAASLIEEGDVHAISAFRYPMHLAIGLGAVLLAMGSFSQIGEAFAVFAVSKDLGQRKTIVAFTVESVEAIVTLIGAIWLPWLLLEYVATGFGAGALMDHYGAYIFLNVSVIPGEFFGFTGSVLGTILHYLVTLLMAVDAARGNGFTESVKNRWLGEQEEEEEEAESTTDDDPEIEKAISDTLEFSDQASKRGFVAKVLLPALKKEHGADTLSDLPFSKLKKMSYQTINHINSYMVDNNVEETISYPDLLKSYGISTEILNDANDWGDLESASTVRIRSCFLWAIAYYLNTDLSEDLQKQMFNKFVKNYNRNLARDRMISKL